MAEVVGLVVAANSLAKTCSTVWKLVKLMIKIGREAPGAVEEEIRSYRLMLKTCFTAVQSAQISLEARWSDEESSCTPAMKYLKKTNFLRDIERLAREIRRKMADLFERTAELPSSWQLWVNYKWHRLKPDFTALLPFMETLKSDLVLAQSTLKLESLYTRQSKEQKSPTGEMTFIMAEIKEIKHDMAQFVDMLHDLQYQRHISIEGESGTVDQNSVLAYLADSMIKKGVVPASPPPRDYKIPKQPDLNLRRRSRRRRHSTRDQYRYRYGEISPPSSQPSTLLSSEPATLPSSEPTTPSSTGPGEISPWRQVPPRLNSSPSRSRSSPISASKEVSHPLKYVAFSKPDAVTRRRKDHSSSVNNDLAPRMSVKSSTLPPVEQKKKITTMHGKYKIKAVEENPTPPSVEEKPKTIAAEEKPKTVPCPSGFTPTRLQFELDSPHTRILASRHRANKPISGHIGSHTKAYWPQDAHLHPSGNVNIISADTAMKLGWEPPVSEISRTLYTSYGKNGRTEVYGTIAMEFVIPGVVELRDSFDFTVCGGLLKGYEVVLGMDVQQWLMRRGEEQEMGMRVKGVRDEDRDVSKTVSDLEGKIHSGSRIRGQG
ncbi:hypothetical protein QC763_608110 [Podospora pseudopauciseta]|uniref:Uncharacterized protein n=1 Tax=Podospora pseudopauciseta TaxID=2093780 RepID=A0ABR0H649_9PEZI|nr:hypothetical protein QC763_608110 [Podospora pseudopauciseta]